MLRKLTVATALALLLSAAPAAAASLQPIGGFEAPIYVTSDPTNPERLFVVERGGRIEQVVDGTVTNFADLSSLVGCGAACSGERGLASIALAPDFAASGRLYVDYANDKSGDIHVDELRASGNTASLGTRREVLTIPHPVDDNHNGGQLQFGPDGYLYIATGDGGGKDDEHENAQNLGRLLGKILRIDPRQNGVLAYTVPAGNPFATTPGARAEIWSYGLRNPFRFSFDRRSGDLLIGDVGQRAREEVDYAPAPGLGAGADYGWNCREGLTEFTPTPPLALDPECATPPATGFTEPVFDYPHTDPGGGLAHGCAIIGGYVIRDPGLTGLAGRYLYGDLCTGDIRSFSLAAPFATDRSEGLVVKNLNSFGEDSCGRLYAISGDGQISRLRGATPTDCTAPTTPGPGAGAGTRAFSYVGLRAGSRSVPRGNRAMITAWVSPCSGRRGEAVNLFRGRRRLGTRHLDRVCSVRFRPRILRSSRFRATVREDSQYVAAQSRRLTIHTRHVPRRHR